MSNPSPDATRQTPEQLMIDAAEMLWIVLANVSEGDWTKQTPDWQAAAARWRDNYFEALRASSAPSAPPDVNTLLRWKPCLKDDDGKWLIHPKQHPCDYLSCPLCNKYNFEPHEPGCALDLAWRTAEVLLIPQVGPRAETPPPTLVEQLKTLELEFLAQTGGDPESPLYTAAEKLHYIIVQSDLPSAPPEPRKEK